MADSAKKDAQHDHRNSDRRVLGKACVPLRVRIELMMKSLREVRDTNFKLVREQI